MISDHGLWISRKSANWQRLPMQSKLWKDRQNRLKDCRRHVQIKNITCAACAQECLRGSRKMDGAKGLTHELSNRIVTYCTLLHGIQATKILNKLNIGVAVLLCPRRTHGSGST